LEGIEAQAETVEISTAKSSNATPQEETSLKKQGVNLAYEIRRRSLSRMARSIQLFDAALREVPDGVSLPDKDAPILLAAFKVRATHLITGDVHHFGRYFGRKIEGLLIVSPADDLKARRAR
jgi:hypothetical protein